MTKISTMLGAIVAITAASATIAQAPLPNWQQLEAYYSQDHGTDSARNRILAALPSGTQLETARAALIADGATCRQNRHKPGMERCLIHQYSLLDGAADDIRWTLTLVTKEDRVTTVLVDRYVDRHGSA